MMIVLHEFVAPAEQIAIEPAVLCTAGPDYVRAPLREGRGFAMQRSGDGGRPLRGIRRIQFELCSVSLSVRLYGRLLASGSTVDS